MGALVGGVGEHGLRIAVLHQFTQVHEHGAGGDAHGLPHVVGDDEDGDLPLQFLHQLLDVDYYKYFI
ncbi:MAG: hypothetical protein IJA95_09550 [Bacteroidaceae bacterium]|nr:hypothetical protein [Bacteroidaceae bacterium]